MILSTWLYGCYQTSFCLNLTLKKISFYVKGFNIADCERAVINHQDISKVIYKLNIISLFFIFTV